MRVVVVLALLAGCYSPTAPLNLPCSASGECPVGQSCRAGICDGDGETVDAPPSSRIDAALDAPGIDAANVCAGGNDTCLVSCVGTDPDCVTTCGDSRCVGNAGELCGNCPGDCAKLTVVCGNADCEPGEAPDCIADCGPTPWTWMQQEQTLIALINSARTNGYACPGMGTVTRPAYTQVVDMLPGARTWAWEIGHHQYFASGDACNGRTLAQRKTTSGNFTSFIVTAGNPSVMNAFNTWMASPTLCPVVMQATVTQISAGVAFDANTAYVVLLK